MISFDEATAIVLKHRWQGDVTTARLSDAIGLVLAQDVAAPFDMPMFDSTSMDGYAVGSLEGPWTIMHEVAAGDSGQTLLPSEAARIFTGAPLPSGAVAILPQEDATVEVHSVAGQAKKGQFIRSKGQEFQAGTQLISAGSRLTPPLIATLAAIGIPEVRVQVASRIAILSTGKELVTPGEPLGPSQVYDCNRYGLWGLLSNLGIHQNDRGRPAQTRIDDLQSTVKAASEAFEHNDLLISTGGASVGDHDHVGQAMTDLGFNVRFDRVAIRPGKPVTFATKGSKAWFGLPGNPTSALVTASLFLPLWLGKTMTWGSTKLLERVDLHGGREDFVPVKIHSDGVRPLAYAGSFAVTSLNSADGLARISESKRAGDIVEVHAFPWI